MDPVQADNLQIANASKMEIAYHGAYFHRMQQTIIRFHPELAHSIFVHELQCRPFLIECLDRWGERVQLLLNSGPDDRLEMLADLHYCQELTTNHLRYMSYSIFEFSRNYHYGH